MAGFDMECNLCKRAVKPTVHTRENYKVEAYRLYTGRVAPVVIKEEGDEDRKFLKLENPCIVTICDSCIKNGSVIDALDKFEAPTKN